MEWIFVGPQVGILLRCLIFDAEPEREGKETSETLKIVVTYTLGNKKAENYSEIITNLLKVYDKDVI